LSNAEKDIFTKLNSQKLYVRLFDVDLQNGLPVTVGTINTLNFNELEAEIIPVIFITNRTFENVQNGGTKLLAENIFRLSKNILDSCNVHNFNELQIDCDWTGSTRQTYFQFLKELKNFSQKKISATIRLHQIKFRKKTGIPPIDHAVVMCYATSSPKDDDERNSILDIALLKNYLAEVDSYPLDFDVALPLFSWAVVRNHLGKIKLINSVTAAELDNPNFVKISENRYKVTEDLFFHGLYINKGFIIDIEQVTPALLNETKTFLNKKLKNRQYRIVYFHLDSTFVNRFTIKDLE